MPGEIQGTTKEHTVIREFDSLKHAKIKKLISLDFKLYYDELSQKYIAALGHTGLSILQEPLKLCGMTDHPDYGKMPAFEIPEEQLSDAAPPPPPPPRKKPQEASLVLPSKRVRKPVSFVELLSDGDEHAGSQASDFVSAVDNSEEERESEFEDIDLSQEAAEDLVPIKKERNTAKTMRLRANSLAALSDRTFVRRKVYNRAWLDLSIEDLMNNYKRQIQQAKKDFEGEPTELIILRLALREIEPFTLVTRVCKGWSEPEVYLQYKKLKKVISQLII